jgi:hypothetical protein
MSRAAGSGDSADGYGVESSLTELFRVNGLVFSPVGWTGAILILTGPFRGKLRSRWPGMIFTGLYWT